MNRPPRKTAFTLIELLTVISIMSMLIALLMPALAGARRRGKITSCQSNLRQIGEATLTYTQQNQDVFPVAAECQGANCIYWNGHQYVGWNGSMLNAFGHNWNRPLNIELRMDPAPIHPGAAKVARCPDDAGAPGQTGSFEPLFEVVGTSYPLNPILCQGRYSDWKYRDVDVGQSQVIQSARKVLAFDHPGFGLTYDEYWTDIRPGWHDKTIPAAGVAFIDGHAEYLTGRCKLQEWQWYAEAPGPDYVSQLRRKVNWTILPGCE